MFRIFFFSWYIFLWTYSENGMMKSKSLKSLMKGWMKSLIKPPTCTGLKHTVVLWMYLTFYGPFDIIISGIWNSHFTNFTSQIYTEWFDVSSWYSLTVSSWWISPAYCLRSPVTNFKYHYCDEDFILLPKCWPQFEAYGRLGIVKTWC